MALELEGEGSFKLGGETYNVKITITKDKKIEKETKDKIQKFLGILGNLYSQTKGLDSNEIKKFIITNLKDFICSSEDKPTFSF